jgi:hypothetical protein
VADDTQHLPRLFFMRRAAVRHTRFELPDYDVVGQERDMVVVDAEVSIGTRNLFPTRLPFGGQKLYFFPKRIAFSTYGEIL